MHRGQLGVALLAAVALASHSGCNDPDCPEGTRKIGISCVPLRAASDGGTSLEGGGDGGSGAAVMGDVRNGPGVDASVSHGGQAEGSAADPDGVVDGGNPTPGKVGGHDAAIASGCSGPTNECGGCTAIEPAHAKGQPCSNGGQGACDLPGAYACLAGTTVCSAPSSTPSHEVCDKKDNDCDGAIDNGFVTGASCTAGLGECRATGILDCNTAGAVACTAVAKNVSTAEVCDGKDNNCDGQIDEGGVCTPACTVKTWYRDCDGDGYAASAGNSAMGCTQPALAAGCVAWTDKEPLAGAIDCNDSDSGYRPGADFGVAGSGDGDRNCDGALELKPRVVSAPATVVFTPPAEARFCMQYQCECFNNINDAQSYATPPCAKAVTDPPIKCMFKHGEQPDPQTCQGVPGSCAYTVTPTQCAHGEAGHEDVYGLVQTCR